MFGFPLGAACRFGLLLFFVLPGQFGAFLELFGSYGVCPAIERLDDAADVVADVFGLLGHFRDLLDEEPRIADFLDHVFHTLEAVLGQLGHQSLDQPIEFRCDVFIEQRRGGWLGGDVSLEQVGGRGSGEGRLSGEHFVDRDPQAVHVGLGDHLLFLDRLGCDVGSGSLDDPVSLLDLAGERKVDQPGFGGLGQQQVVGLDVSMDPSLGVHIPHRLTDLLEYLLQSSLSAQGVAGHGDLEIL